MGSENSTSVNAGDFLYAANAADIFGELDFKLKDGFHISNVRGQYDDFRFVETNEESLMLYYHRYFRVPLERGGEGEDRYYHLNFDGLTRGAIDIDHRSFLKNEYIIIGLLLYKVIFIDKDIELSSVKKYQETVKRDYEELKPDLYRLLAKAKGQNASTLNDQKLDEMIQDAFTEFRKIGWIGLEDDEFEIYPAFQRLNKLFSDYINDIDNIIKKWSEK